MDGPRTTQALPGVRKGKHLHPIQEAGKAIAKIEEIRNKVEELLVLRFEATNMEPYPSSWADAQEASRDYSSALVRLSSQFDQRF